MDSQQELQKRLADFASLEVNEPSTWRAVTVRCLTRLKRSNLAIVAVVATSALDAYRGLPVLVTLTAFCAVTVLGIFGGARER
ncbi:hypothetical protein BWP39_17100 [Paraburkholderia acidicola]|uniref:Uncharacterized protein n=1 Tax=Paraburkholderia acidicola TaxID=1912599 RepID=A0A2A4F0N7_9BURK|nr:hypothetical protein [Paraburkholderia acidicola]PCE26240.1 hypothetical protein BWP39_17100 [Paraburkholderia acidicola]